MHRVLRIHDDGTLDVICIVGSAVGRRRHITRPDEFVVVDLSDADLWRDVAHSYAIEHDAEGYLGPACNCATCNRFRVLSAEREGNMGRLRNGQGLPDDDTIRELAKTHRQSQIAAMYGVTRGAVSYRFRALGLTKAQSLRPPGTADVLQAIIQYKSDHDGCSPTLKWLSEKLEVSINKIWRLVGLLVTAGKVKRAGRGLMVVGARWEPPPELDTMA